jgi:hypothetical protein
LEIVEFRRTAVLQIHSKIRQLWIKFKKQSGQESYPIHLMSEPILFEIAIRKYREDGINI